MSERLGKNGETKKREGRGERERKTKERFTAAGVKEKELNRELWEEWVKTTGGELSKREKREQEGAGEIKNSKGKRKEKAAVREKVEKEENCRKLRRLADEEAIFPASFQGFSGRFRFLESYVN